MDPAVARRLVSAEGAEALAAARAERDPDALSAAERLRSWMPPELAAAALDQASLRPTALAKIGQDADSMLWTRDGLEQATRGPVSRWRAGQLADAGVRRVIDLGCACGADARACLDLGLEVTAVEIDPALAVLARHNLPGARVLEGDAEELAADLLAGAGSDTAILLDPARRTGRGRSWRVEDIRPAWDFVMDMTAVGRGVSTVVKLGPGVPREILPEAVAVTWVGHRHDLVEATLWAGPAAPGRTRPGHTAILVGETPEPAIALPGGETELGTGPVGEFLAEPHPAVIRARAMRAAAGGRPVHLPAPGVAYLLAATPTPSPWLTWFRVIEELPLQERALRTWVRQHRVGRLEIKKRGVDVDPAALRRRLRPSGRGAATLILTPTGDGARALVAERITG
ncbi:THUMP-like domain-containing protein [Acidipropionibacterium jensenii]|uniref:THUMP-like domain-containing protein n=2 Tax=Acidipropionibacterium jensenii TaxID=1749 RepID=UPI00264965A1|nr:SAM-dependent methyltransferase [Acidipropionibacterium jensenii]MDN6591930.1 class I SAM-dependent methyltransferase [Acidipropionibacterium jensenii]